jgi:hypothetical protein
MRPLLIGLGLVVATACGDDAEMACDCAAVGCSAEPCTKTVFVTRTEMAANFGGVTAADDLCAQEAANAGLAGTYFAWLSDATRSPFVRFSRATVPYVLPDGTAIAPDWDTLVDAGPSVPIAQHADASAVPPDDGSPAQVWTGTSIDGRADTYNNASNYCSNWTRNVLEESALVGWVYERVKPGLDWTRANLVPCTGSGYLYCFQQ